MQQNTGLIWVCESGCGSEGREGLASISCSSWPNVELPVSHILNLSGSKCLQQCLHINITCSPFIIKTMDAPPNKNIQLYDSPPFFCREDQFLISYGSLSITLNCILAFSTCYFYCRKLNTSPETKQKLLKYEMLEMPLTRLTVCVLKASYVFSQKSK